MKLDDYIKLKNSVEEYSKEQLEILDSKIKRQSNKKIINNVFVFAGVIGLTSGVMLQDTATTISSMIVTTSSLIYKIINYKKLSKLIIDRQKFNDAVLGTADVDLFYDLLMSADKKIIDTFIKNPETFVKIYGLKYKK